MTYSPLVTSLLRSGLQQLFYNMISKEKGTDFSIATCKSQKTQRKNNSVHDQEMKLPGNHELGHWLNKKL